MASGLWLPRDGVLSRPAVMVNPHLDCLTVDAGFPRPIANMLSLAESSNQPSPAAVSDLLGSRGPAAIAGLIVAIIVDAVQLMLGAWRSADVGEKRFKTRAPPLTNTDASASVPRIAADTRICAAGNHHPPCPPLFRAVLVSGLPVLPVFCSHSALMA